jgi:hypothetical protein
MYRKILLFIIIFQITVIRTGNANIITAEEEKSEVVLKPAGSILMTEVIQQAIDKCASEGGGTVRFTEGTYHSGTIQLKSKVTLHLDNGVLIQGSDKYSDYRNDAFFYGKELSDISITGDGIIDGVDCYNSKGEEGFRGPHCIRLISCKNILLNGFTIKNSANWAINCRYCSGGNVTNVTILGGHDGLHTRFCDHFTVKKCDFRTGDDAFAGNDNHDFTVSDCLINTSCNGFRIGCLNLTVKHCRLWGPGESMHKIQKRNNMLSAFVHFSPKDEKPQLQSGNWMIEDVIVENVDHFFMYNFKNGLWQTGQPFTSVRFKKITASGILNAFYIKGDTAKLFEMSIKNSSFTFRNGTDKKAEIFEGVRLLSREFFYANSFTQISLENATFGKEDSSILLSAESGGKIILDRVNFNTGSDLQPFRFYQINDIQLNKLFVDDLDITGKPLKPIKIVRKVPYK